MPARWAYIRLDTQHYGSTELVADAKLRLAGIFSKLQVPYGNIIDEDPGNVGDKPDNNDVKKYGVTYHSRPFLQTLLTKFNKLAKYNDDKGKGNIIPNGQAAGDKDTVYISNLSHLSTDPAVIGQIVYTFLTSNNPRVYLAIGSVGLSSEHYYDAGTPPEKAFFDGLAALKDLGAQAPRIKGGDGGGDGGGNGGC
jgi:hypothetical protein